jgi:hypothetical protein
MNQILIIYCHFQVFELCYIFKGSITYLNVNDFALHSGKEISTYTEFYLFTSRPISLLASIKEFLFVS